MTVSRLFLPTLAGIVFSFAAARADVILNLDASSLSTGSISEWKDTTSAWLVRSASPLRVEKTQGRVEVWALNPSVEKAEVLVALAPEPRNGSTTDALEVAPLMASMPFHVVLGNHDVDTHHLTDTPDVLGRLSLLPGTLKRSRRRSVEHTNRQRSGCRPVEAMGNDG